MNARDAIARFVDANVPRLQEWLEQIALKDGPEKAYRCVLDVIEYHIPKLARIETTSDKGIQIFIGSATTVQVEPLSPPALTDGSERPQIPE